MSPLIDARGLDLDTPEGRPLVRELSVQLGRERVALVGRNGVGKSTLLRVLAGEARPTRGTVRRRGRLVWVPQDLSQPTARSPGERRQLALATAFRSGADLLLLDEPTEDLDAAGREALFRAVEGWRGGLVVVSHDRQLLDHIGAYFVMEEAGCHLVTGTVADLRDARREAEVRRERAYVRALRNLAREEDKHERVAQRRARKKAVGRIHELDRNQARIRLNARRSSAQISQAKVRLGAEARRDARRGLVRAMRRALEVQLPLSDVVPEPGDGPLVAHGLHVWAGGQPILDGVDLTIDGSRVALVGPNGAGKTTVLETLVGQRPPHGGWVRADPLTLGWIAQGGENWRRDESLVDQLARYVDADGIAARLTAHRFPLAMARRAMASLSPGERTRAALIALFERPRLSCLVLDEPTRCLDLVGAEALAEALRGWRGGLVVASHDVAFLEEIGMDEVMSLGAIDGE